MAVSIFDDKLMVPDDRALTKALGELKSYWDEILAYLDEEYDDIRTEWKFYSKKAGWTLPVKKKKQSLLYLIPCKDNIRGSFIFGSKAVAALKRSSVPANVIREILNAQEYRDGRVFKFEVRLQEDVENIKKLIQIKVEN